MKALLSLFPHNVYLRIIPGKINHSPQRTIGGTDHHHLKGRIGIILFAAKAFGFLTELLYYPFHFSRVQKVFRSRPK